MKLLKIVILILVFSVVGAWGNEMEERLSSILTPKWIVEKPWPPEAICFPYTIPRFGRVLLTIEKDSFRADNYRKGWLTVEDYEAWDEE